MGIFRKQWGVDALYGLVECASVGEAMGTALSQGIVCLGKCNGEWMFRGKQWGMGILKKNNGERASWRAQVRWWGEEGHRHGIPQGVGRLVRPSSVGAGVRKSWARHISQGVVCLGRAMGNGCLGRAMGKGCFGGPR